ncbi:AAA family ATPase [Paracoccus gahaiensis]|uniref:AAA family ATPase n=1 Tax=Paracoccus gahaiensis TaxID=1706839 RepID=UPI003CCC7892
MYLRNVDQAVQSALASQAAGVLLGPRQVGKTPLAWRIAEHQPSVYLDLERDSDRQVLTEPNLYLDEQAGKLVILDEVQQMPGLFRSLRGQIDMRRRKGLRTGQFLLLGSASNVLLRQSAESLAGRVR